MRILGMNPLILLLAICLGASSLLSAQDSDAEFLEIAPGLTAYVNKDYVTAFAELKPLAERGRSKAQIYLGHLYNNGDGVIQDKREAVRWYRSAAVQGSVEAQSILGIMYSAGRGVTQDFVYSHMWFNIAAANGSEQDSKNRDIVAKDMTPSQIEQAQILARGCLNSGYLDC